VSNWQEIYKQKLTIADEAIKLIQNGDRIIVPLANGQPPGLIAALVKQIKSGDFRELIYVDALNVQCPEIHAPETAEKINAQLDDRKFKEDSFNVVMFTVSPMDKHGFFSTGINPDYAFAVTRQPQRPKILLEVNEKMPRTYGNNQLHISEITAVIENNSPLYCLPEIPLTKEDEIIAGYITEQVPDGACLQLGSGSIPNTLGKFLSDKKDLSVHTEMLCDSYRELYLEGVITCREKTYMSGKWLASFVLGSQELYDFVDKNPLIELWGAQTIIDPAKASLNDKLISINTALEVDLSGQCALEQAAYRQFTNTACESSFVEASWQSKGGKSFIAAYSTYTDTEGKLQSKIVPALNNFVAVGRADVQYVVTEYGIVFLKGRSINSRAEELINIAHPDFRDWLKFEFKKLMY
jgi:acyl-CoA hydrolase